MTRIKPGLIVRIVAFALMACALAVIGCNLAPGAMPEKEKPPTTETPDANAGIKWRMVRAGGDVDTGGEVLPLLEGVAWTGSRFVAVGRNGTIVHSADGDRWTEASSTITEDALRDVAWNGSRLVAVGHDRIVYSSDGDRWTQASAAAVGDDSLVRVAWGDSSFVAVGFGGSIVYSPDGATWTKAGDSGAERLRNVAWGRRPLCRRRGRWHDRVQLRRRDLDEGKQYGYGATASRCSVGGGPLYRCRGRRHDCVQQ